MTQKRPFSETEAYEVPFKHPRQVDHSDKHVSVSEFPPEDDVLKHHISGEGESGSINCFNESGEILSSDIVVELPRCTHKDGEIGCPGCISNSSWATSSTSEEDIPSEGPLHLQFFPDYYNLDPPTRRVVRPEDVYSYLLEYPPRKLVSIGSDFQAEIPEWSKQDCKSTSSFISSEGSSLSSQTSDENKFSGDCIIPMPEIDLCGESGDSSYNNVGDGRTDCCCGDVGSTRCVRSHINEAREKLRRMFGEETLVKLGFYDMGEVVAERWSEEEEHLFHEVVYSNPASLGRNFWDFLPLVFPSRTKREIVSYYFNVFILRKRSNQNRCEALNIDSDNDELQKSDDSGDDGVVEEDGSVIESPVYQDFPRHIEIHEDDSCNNNEMNVGCNEDNLKIYDNGNFNHLSQSHEDKDKIYDNGTLDHLSQSHDKNNWDERGDRDVQDDSCTSFDAQAHVESSKRCMGGHSFISEHCDAKVWEVGNYSRPRNETDFLPTYNVIEEVLGVGAWNFKARDGESMS